MLEGIRAVIFDLDGTLMDSMWMWHDIDVEYLGRYGYEPPEDLEREIEGMGFTETAEYFKKRFALPDTVETIKQDWIQMAEQKYAQEVHLKPGAAEFLAKLYAQGIKIGIASSNSRALIQACLGANGVAGYFACITTSCDVAQGKPAPDVYLHAADMLEADARECLVFEDVPMGIRAGRNAGMRVCAVKDAFSENQTAKIRALADYYITSYYEVMDGSYEVLHSPVLNKIEEQEKYDAEHS